MRVKTDWRPRSRRGTLRRRRAAPRMRSRTMRLSGPQHAGRSRRPQAYGVDATGDLEVAIAERGVGFAIRVADPGRVHGEFGSLATRPTIRAWLLGVARLPHRHGLHLTTGVVPVAGRAAPAQAPQR